MSSCAFAPEPTLFDENSSGMKNDDTVNTTQDGSQDMGLAPEAVMINQDPDAKGIVGEVKVAGGDSVKQAGIETTSGIQSETQEKAGNTNELKEMIQQRQQEMSQEMSGLDEEQQKIYQNQNKVRSAVHSLLAMEDLVHGIGPQISDIAKQFNNSVQATISSEEKIENRGFLSRMLTGGDAEAAGELEREVIQNRARIEELSQIKTECECDPEVKAIMQEQIQNIEQEQTRLEQLAQSEKESKGLIGWLWK
ncbi:MAG: hypothetical protein KAI51_03935 [Candidatus Aenigmarchaeota archaeon]|nr:hypothetical protein [Candidatus Aenigmarchaeota archaeon]